MIVDKIRKFSRTRSLQNSTENSNREIWIQIDTNFEISKFNYFGGAYKEGETQNAYYLAEMGGVKYLFISLEFGADDGVLDWANGVLPQYPDHRVVMFTHGYLTTSGERMVDGDKHCPSGYGFASKVQVNNPDQMFDKFVRKHKNMFMILNTI